MKIQYKITTVIAAIAFLQGAYAEDISPLKDLEIGMTYGQLTTNYPDIKLAFTTTNNGDITECLGCISVTTNLYWDAGMVTVTNSLVDSFSYVKTVMTSQITNNVPQILKTLIQTYGSNYTMEVVEHIFKYSTNQAPVLFWTATNKVVAFTFDPLLNYRTNDFYISQLSFYATNKPTSQLFTILQVSQSQRAAMSNAVYEAIQAGQ